MPSFQITELLVLGKIFEGFYHMSRVMRKPTFWFPTRSDTNQAVKLQKMARGLKFRIKKLEGSYYLCSENKGVDQLRGYFAVTAKLICVFVFAYAKCLFSHVAAHIWAWRPSWSCDLSIYISFSSPFPRRLHIKFGFDWQIGFKEVV